jgi:hypothetical protein
MMRERLSVSANAALDLVGESMAEIEKDLGDCDAEDRSKRLSHMAANLQAEHQRNGGEDTPASLIRGAAIALLVLALAGPDVE